MEPQRDAAAGPAAINNGHGSAILWCAGEFSEEGRKTRGESVGCHHVVDNENGGRYELPGAGGGARSQHTPRILLRRHGHGRVEDIGAGVGAQARYRSRILAPHRCHYRH